MRGYGAESVPHNFLGEVLRPATFHSSHNQRARCAEDQEYHETYKCQRCNDDHRETPFQNRNPIQCLHHRWRL